MEQPGKAGMNWTATSCVVAILALAGSLFFNTMTLRQAIRAAEAQRLSTELQILTQVQKTVNESIMGFLLRHREHVGAYLHERQPALSEVARTELFAMMNDIEYFLWLWDGDFQAVSDRAMFTDALKPGVTMAFMVIRKEQGGKADDVAAQSYPHCVKLVGGVPPTAKSSKKR